MQIPDTATCRGYPPLPELPHGLIGKLRVMVDGEEKDGVYAYSISQGWVLSDMRDATGQIVIADGELIPVRLAGRVEIVPR